MSDPVESNGPATTQATNAPDKKAGGATGRGFMPGQSGNPGGRAKTLPELKAKCRDMTDKILERLTVIIDHGEHKDSVAASKLVLAYAYGNPTQPISGAEDAPPVGVSVLLPALQKLLEAKKRGA